MQLDIEVPVDRDRSEFSRDDRDGGGISKVALKLERISRTR
jgi:hypothetical protein